MALTCPRCGKDNPDGFAFCGFCRAPLAERSPPEERRTVSVLFCDLVAFTAASQYADPEDVRARIDPYFSRLRHAAESYGGTVDKFIGDAIMAVFGVPVAHEDDPERAVRAGMRILDEIVELNATDPSLDLTVRVGINTGEVLARVAPADWAQGIVTGDVVNTASRLQAAAPEGSVIVSETTYAATKAVFDYQALDPVVVKGKSDPLPVWRAVAPRARFGTDLMRDFSVQLIGRTPELNLLRLSFERSLRDSTFHLLTITGDAGVGKSRLVAELSHIVDARPELIRWRQGRCLPYGEGITFWALGEILKAEAGIYDTDKSDTAGAKIDVLVPDNDPDAAWMRQRLRPLVGLEAAQASRDENFAAWRRFLESLAERDPTVLVIEDLHWADEALLAFVEHVAEHAEGVPLLLVITARPELYDKTSSFLAGARNTTRIDLEPLNETDIATLISRLLGSAALPEDILHALLSRAGGNPLYAEEFVRLLKDRGILHRRGPTWTLDRDAQIPVPPGISNLIAARLDTLDLEWRRLLADASVIGQVFWSGAVSTMSSTTAEQVEQGLRALSRADLIKPVRRSSMEGEHEYAFLHALVRDACYAQIPRAKRSERHARAASWIQRMAGERVEDFAEILVSHYTTALKLARAAMDPKIAELESQTIRFLVLAGDRAMGIDVVAAERHYATALELTPSGRSSQRPDLLARYAEALRQRGRFREAAAVYEEAIEGFRDRADVNKQAVAMADLSVIAHYMADPDSELELTTALAMLEPNGPSQELVRVLTECAGEAFVAYDNDRAIALGERAIAMARALGLEEPARALGFIGAARTLSGDSSGLADLRRGLVVAIERGLGRDAAVMHYNLAVTIWAFEGNGPYLAGLEEGLAFAQRRGIGELELAFRTGIAKALVDLGELTAAERAMDEVIPDLERSGNTIDLCLAQIRRVRMFTWRGKLNLAAPLAEWVVEQGRAMPTSSLLCRALPVLAAVRLGQRRSTDALALLSEFEQAPNGRATGDYAEALPVVMRTALAAGDQDLAGRIVDGVQPLLPVHQLGLLTASALLAEARGDFAEADARFADAATRWHSFQMPWEHAHALLGHARCLLAMGAIGVEDVLREARDIFSSLEANHSIANVNALMERALRVRARQRRSERGGVTTHHTE
jgi:class 3 adenylate cyclase/tetratricopeptide (TPR) repeat protein